jgi:hypothetical protein
MLNDGMPPDFERQKFGKVQDAGILLLRRKIFLSL